MAVVAAPSLLELWSIWTTLSNMWSDFRVVLCGAKSCIQWFLWVPSSLGCSILWFYSMIMILKLFFCCCLQHTYIRQVKSVILEIFSHEMEVTRSFKKMLIFFFTKLLFRCWVLNISYKIFDFKKFAHVAQPSKVLKTILFTYLLLCIRYTYIILNALPQEVY